MIRLPFSPRSLYNTAVDKATAFSHGFDSHDLDLKDDTLFEGSHTDYETRIKYLSSDHDAYGDRTTIDWLREYAKERLRILRSGRMPGLGGLGVKLWNTAAPWLVISVTGVLTGLLAAFLAVITLWLSDLRQGVCPSEFYLRASSCCAGLEPHELCYSWVTWADYFGLKTRASRAIVPYSLYLLSSVGFAASSAILVRSYAPQAFHTGIPEIKTILNGYILQGFLSTWTLVIKSLGLTLAVASGLSLGNEGPLVHVACSIGHVVANHFAIFRNNEARKREILSAAAAAGISVAFGAPLGGVLFSLEELSSFFPDFVLWQSFVCAIVAAVVFQYVDPYGTGRLVLFQVTSSQVWRGFELVPFVFLGVVGGVFGHYFIRFNIAYAKFRSSEFDRRPLVEVTIVALLTALVSYLITFARVPTTALVESLFSDCSNDTLGLCDRDRPGYVIFLLLFTALVKTAMTAVTFGMRVPAGIFLPSIAIGSCIGRAVGIAVSSFQQAYPLFFFFSGCPADGACVSPPIYALIGAAAVLGGVTRMTISLTVVFFELTGAVTSVLSIMIAVMVSKFTGDFLARDGIYESWIKLRAYPFLDPKVEYRRDSVFVRDVMTPASKLVFVKQSDWTLAELETFAQENDYHGYPVVKSLEEPILCGFILHTDLTAAITQARLRRGIFGTTRCSFAERSEGNQNAGNSEHAGILDLASWTNQTPMTLSVNSPHEIAVQLFQRMGLRYLLLTRRGRVMGLLTKSDVHEHVSAASSTSARADLLRRQRGESSVRQRRASTSTRPDSIDETDDARFLGDDHT